MPPGPAAGTASQVTVLSVLSHSQARLPFLIRSLSLRLPGKASRKRAGPEYQILIE